MSQLTATTHRAFGLIPACQLIADEGLDLAACLRGTGLARSDLDKDDALITLAQEVRFFRNLMAQSGDPALALRLGRRYPPQRYGIFGYALLSAATLRHAMAITTQFGDYLTFTWLHVSFRVEGAQGIFGFCDRVPLDDDMRAFFYVRDLMASKTAFEELMGRSLPLDWVHLPGQCRAQRAMHAQAFGCPVSVDDPAGGALSFPSRYLELPLPFNDTVASERLQQQCRLLMNRMGHGGGMAERVRQMIVGRPGYFPAIEAVAEKLDCSVRTLRQRLTDEGTGYQKILDEVRLTLAREYLDQTQLPLVEIAPLLGFSDAGNFTHAFKKWTGQTPSAVRRQRAG